MTTTKLPGGSLSNTYILRGSTDYVRKECYVSKNKEYGYRRWHSQLKRLQRYNILFPGMFPRVLKWGWDIVQGVAYYDMQKVEGVTAYEFLNKRTDKAPIEHFLRRLIEQMNRLHKPILPSSPSAIEMYFEEEVCVKIMDCQTNLKFWVLARSPHVEFNGEKVPSLLSEIESFHSMFTKYYTQRTETFTHGNLTLENIIYNPDNDNITFIDPYEENVIDSALCDYSQILQSCNSNYELYNEKGGDAIPAEGMVYFNEIFHKHLVSKFAFNPNCNEMISIRLFEISQFVRMLPFKAIINEEKMIFFYKYASKLFHDLKKELGE